MTPTPRMTRTVQTLIMVFVIITLPIMAHGASPEQDLRFGFSSFRLGDDDSALFHINRALGSAKLSARDNLTALTLRGDIYRRTRKYDESLTDYNKVIKLTIDMGEGASLGPIYLKRGIVHRNLGEYDSAITDYNLTLQLDSNNADAYFHRGNAYRLKRKLQMALSDFDRAISLRADHEFFYYRSGVLTQLNRLAEAVADMETAVRLRPNRKAYKARLNYLKSKLGD